MSKLLLDLLTHAGVAVVPVVMFVRETRKFARAKQENRNLRLLVSSTYGPTSSESVVRHFVQEALRNSVPVGTPAKAKITLGTPSGGSIVFEVKK